MKNPVQARYAATFLFCLLSLASFAQWSAVNTAYPGNMHCVTLLGNQIFIGGDALVKSPNGGGSWSVQTLKHTTGFDLTATTLYDLHFFDNQNGVAVGFILGASEDIILRTTNGGQNWSYAYEGIGNGGPFGYILRDLFFINASTGWAVGRNGNIYKTTNAGVSWTLQASGTSDELYSVYFVNANLGFAAGDNALLKTTNGGATWAPTSLAGGAEKVAFVNTNVGFAGAGNTLHKTTDGGQNWTTLPVPPVNGYLTDLHFIDQQTGYLLFNNTVLRTTDGGQSWEETAANNGLADAQQFEWLNAQQSVIAGGTLFCWITNNAGAPYKPIAAFSLGTELCSGTPQQLLNQTADLPNYTYQWYLNNVPVSNLRNPAITFPNPDTDYTIRLEVSNGTATDVVEKPVHTLPLATLATPIIQNNGLAICQGEQSLLFGNLDYAFWTLSANGQPTGLSGFLTQLNYSSFPQTTTTFHLHGELSGACNTATADQDLTVGVIPLPLSAEVVAEKSLVCQYDSTRIFILNSVPGVSYRLYASSFFANPDDTQVGNGDTLFFQTPPVQDVLSYFLEVKNQGCQRNLGLQVNISPEFVLAFLYDKHFAAAAGQLLQLNDTLNLIGNTVAWDFGPQALPPTATGKNPTFQFTQPGFYNIQVAVTGLAGCVKKDTVTVEVFAPNSLPPGPMTTCDDHVTPLLASNVEAREHILDVYRAPDGTTYTVGYRMEYEAGFHYNLSINKLDAAGNLLFSYFLSQFTQPTANVQRIGTTIAADEAGNMYLTGTYYGSEIELGGENIYSGPPTLEGFVAKLNPQGNLLWHIRAPGSSPVGATDLLYVNDQQIYLVAPETYIFQFPNGFEYHFPDSTLLGLIQINADGEFIRAKRIAKLATTNYHVIISNFNPNLSSFSGAATTRLSPRMVLDKQGRLVICGEYKSPMRVGNFLLEPKIPDQRNGFVAITDFNFNVLNAFTTYGVADVLPDQYAIYHQTDGPPAFALDHDGNIFESFTIDNSTYFLSQPYHFAEVLDDQVEYGDDSHFLLKYSPAGDLLWYRRNGPLHTPWLATGPDGAVHALASYGSVLGLNDADGTKRSIPSLGGADIALVSWDADGAVQGALPLGSADDDDIEWLSSDGCGGLSGLLAQHVGPFFQGDPYQHFHLLQLDEGPFCTPECPFEICLQPQDVSFCRGEKAYLYAGAVGQGLSYQWQSDLGTGFSDLSEGSVFMGTQTALLTIEANAAIALSAQPFRCVVTDGSQTQIISNPASPMPLDTPLLAPLPLVTEIAMDQVITLSIQAQGNGLQYEWQYLSPGGWQAVGGLSFYFYAYSNAMQIKGFDFDLQNGQQLRCRVLNANGCYAYSSVTTLQFVSGTNQPVAGDAGFQILAWPSPFAENIDLAIRQASNTLVEWTIFDLNGREMIQLTEESGREKIQVSSSGWPDGMYWIRAQADGKVAWKRVVKTKG